MQCEDRGISTGRPFSMRPWKNSNVLNNKKGRGSFVVSSI